MSLPRFYSMVRGRAQMVRAMLVTVVVVLATAGGSLLYTETATVKLSAPRQSLEAYVPLSGGPTGGPLATHRFNASVTDSQQGTASMVPIGPTYASGLVVFRCSPSCQRAPVIIAQGQLITTAGGLDYATQEPATITTNTGSVTVTVRAALPGAAWNAGIDSLTIMAGNSDSGLKVTNPIPVVGGADARSAQVIQQSDYDAVRNALTDKVNHELGVALFTNSHGEDYVGDPWPVITTTSDHAVGDETPSFTIKMSASDGATAFFELDANSIMLAALKAKVPPGEELTNDPVQYIYQSHQMAPGADVLVTGKADGFVLPKPLSVRSLIRGLSAADAARSLQRMAPGSRVEIRISPAAVQWLPFIADHISVTVVVEQGRS